MRAAAIVRAAKMSRIWFFIVSPLDVIRLKNVVEFDFSSFNKGFDGLTDCDIFGISNKLIDAI